MKKIILPVLLVASSLVFFSFKPMTKAVAVKDKEVKTAPTKVLGCTELFKTFSSFSECYRVNNPEVPTQPGEIILAKY
jgi:hypothetical protein